MKRRGMSLALCAAMAMGTIGVVPAMADDVTTITYWVNDRHDSEYMTEMVEKYNKENTDNIYIDMQIITDDYENMISLAYTGGTAPDIIGQSVTLKNFVDNDMLVPLNDYIDADEEYQKVNEPYEHAYEGLNYMDGNLYWVYSGMRSGVRIEYNKDLLEKSGYTEIPKTLDEYIDMAKKITEDGNGEYYGIGFTSSSPFERQLEMMAQVSGIYYYDYVNGKFDFSGYKEILEKKSMGFMMSEWDEKLLKYGHLFETKLMDLSVNIPLEEALDLGWGILAECFEPNETGLKTSLLQERWPKKDALN